MRSYLEQELVEEIILNAGTMEFTEVLYGILDKNSGGNLLTKFASSILPQQEIKDKKMVMIICTGIDFSDVK